MSNTNSASEFPWPAFLKDRGPATDLPALQGLPVMLPESLYQTLFAAGSCAPADIILSQMDVAAAVAAAAGAGQRVKVFFAHTDIRMVQRCFRELQRRGLSDCVLFFHGSVRNLLRDIPMRPLAVAARDASDVLDLWHDLPRQAMLLVTKPFAAENQWVTHGFLERIDVDGGTHFSVFRTTSRFPAAKAVSMPDTLFRQLRTDLLSCYFMGARSTDANYTPVAALTEDARRWALHHAAHPGGGYEGWPYTSPATVPLPETLPNGERWPLISVVTPSYNQGRYLEETILSVHRQGYPRLEHILMDGGSKDETLEVMARYRHLLTHAVSEKDRGQAHAINKGMALTTGDVLTWLNSDDMLAPGALGAVAMGFHTSRADLVAGIVLLRSDNQFVDSHMTCCPPGPLPLDTILDLDGGWNAGQFFYQPEVMFSRGAWERAGGKVREDLYYSMDYDLWVRMAESGARLHAIGRPVAWFRVHEEQKTSVAEKFMAELNGYVADYNKTHNRVPPPAASKHPDRRKLRILMLNDHGFKFGAGIAHKRMTESLVRAGHDVQAAAFLKEPGHHGRPSELTSDDLLHAVRQLNPDLIITGNVHSATQEPWHLGRLAEQFPTLSVLHDFWWLTGRCAYPSACGKHLTGCDHTCPTASSYPKLAPEKVAPAWEQKQKLLFSNTKLALLGNSAWTCDQARQMMQTTGRGRPAVPVAQFRLSFPLDIFRPLDKRSARVQLGLPEDRFIVVLAGDLYDTRKNTRVALQALESLEVPNLTVVALGYRRPGESFQLDIHRPGHIDDMRVLAAYYAAADVLLAPSSEETFGQVFIEAAACSTPVVGVRRTGMQEAVVDGVTGILVDEISPEALAGAVLELYRKPDLRKAMGAWGRLYAENEWSPEASYYHMFQAWRSLGLLRELNVQPKIAFRMDEVKLPEVELLQRMSGVTLGSFAMGFEEGPFPEYNLPVFRWAYGPESRITLLAPQAGSYWIVIKYRNLHEGQHLTLSVNSQSAGEYPMPVTGMSTGRTVVAPAALTAGENRVALQFSRWMQDAGDNRPLAAAITDVFLLPNIQAAAKPA